MAFEKPPSLDDYEEIIVEKPREITTAQKVARGLSALLLVGVVILGLLNFWKSDLAAPLRGTGSVRGIALDEHGQPLAGNIYVEGTTLQAKTNPDGSFELKNIPAGKQLIVVADTASGREFLVQIDTGVTSDLGTVTLQSTATP